MLADEPISSELVEADQCVTALRSSLSHGGTDLKNIPELVKIILTKEMWRRRFVAQRQKEVEFTSFVEFVEHPAPEGLGTSLAEIQRFCSRAGDLTAVDLVDQNQARPDGRPTKTVNIINGLKRPQGTSTARTLRHLRDSRPDLHQRVLAGELSPGAAMVKAGLRIKTHTIPHDPTRAAGVIRRHFSREEVEEIIRQLQRAEYWTEEIER